MTQTTTLPELSPEAAPAEASPRNPADILLNLIITLLAPMFLVASGGDILFARAAALQTVDSYRIRNDADLVSIAQIIAFGLAALGSLSLSMTDNLSLSMTLRLRSNANACNRSAEQNRRALKERGFGIEAPANTPPATSPDDGFDEAEVWASVMAAQKRAAETQARMQGAKPAADPTPLPGPAPAPTLAVVAPMTAEQERQAMWATAAANVAAELTAEFPNLPPAERRLATIRAAALSSCAHDLLSGKVAPRLRPGDLAAVMQPNAARKA